MLFLLLLGSLATANAHSCLRSLRGFDPGFESVYLRDGEAGVSVRGWRASDEDGDVSFSRVAPYPLVLNPRAGAEHRASFTRLGSTSDIRAAYNIGPEINDDSVFYSIRLTDCPDDMPVTFEGSGCRVLLGDDAYLNSTALAELAALQAQPQLLPVVGDVYLVRIADIEEGTGVVRDRLVTKLIVVEHRSRSGESATLRWTNLYDGEEVQRIAFTGRPSLCTDSGDAPNFDPESFWSSYWGPQIYESGWTEALLLLFLVLFIILFILVMGLTAWTCRKDSSPHNVPAPRPASQAASNEATEMSDFQ